MENLITVYTQVYNTKPFLSKCIESVLGQTYSNFEYVLIDNGSTDGCKEILEQYAARDRRIRLIRVEENQPFPIWRQIAREVGAGKYISQLDSDDWLAPSFLERMVSLMEENQLDIACTGTAFHMEGQEHVSAGSRSQPKRIILERSQYADYFPCYHAFFRTTWGKVLRRSTFLAADVSVIDREQIKNGADTLAAFAWLRQARRICVDDSILHHYLVRNKSVSRIYLPNRFKSNTVLHRDAMDFLSQYGPVSEQNRHFLHIVYANAVFDTLEVLWNSDLTPEEKLAEYCVVAIHPTTKEAFQDVDSAVSRSRDTLRRQFTAVSGTAKIEPGHFAEAVQTLFPRCGYGLTLESMSLFRREQGLLKALIQDDPELLTKGLIELIQTQRYTKQYDLGRMLCTLAAGRLLLANLDDMRFIREYPVIYWNIWQGKTLDALDEMTGILLGGRPRKAEEVFLQLYMSLSAWLEQASAFLFGKIRWADFLLRKNRTQECKTVLDELEEMGLSDNPELFELRYRLEKLISR